MQDERSHPVESSDDGFPRSLQGSTAARTPVQSVERAAAVLSFLASTQTGATVQEIARGTSLNRTVAHRLTRTLEGLGMVSRSTTGRYLIGPAMLAYGSRYLDGLAVTRVAIPYLLDFRQRAVGDRPWLVSLSVPVGLETVTVERLWHPDAPLDTILTLGSRLPITSSASGKALLSTMRTTSLIDLVGIETAQALGPELDVVRAQGNVAFVRYDMDPGIGAASAAVVGPDGEAVAAVTVSGGDLDAEMRPNSHLWSLLRQVAQSISTASGAFPVMSPRE